MSVPIDYMHLSVVIIWLVYYGIRLIEHSHNHVFLKMPWLVLWFTAYVFGWCYILNNYDNQINLEHTIFHFTTFPVTIIGKLIASSLVYLLFFYTVRFHSPFRQSWYRESLLVVALVVSCAGIVFLWHQDQDYAVLFWIGDILLFVNAMVASIFLLPIGRQLMSLSIPALEYIHLIWFAGCIWFAGIGLVLITISAVEGLFTHRIVVRDVWLNAGYLACVVSLICMMVVNSSDKFIDRTAFFLRWIYIRRLNRLYYYILNHVMVVERYPITPYGWGQPTEPAIYERVYSILDMYPFLSSDHPLFQQIQNIEQKFDRVPDCVEALIQIRIPKL